ncbi:[FeFe] hydrogenase H-cluster radical SAM maturase HydG [Pseudodesulfovibrio sp. zrk46]|uniref:[FeFe] hydrogenase H-cluster radical SAM maturase HydG n=1 Tax=Pseudodesulfovibrio sp. zrk46 TaxID=2725288 RepID=UPI001449C949|nr:[FeFe] hydrogenase H-cluster radical SAM maturase HydG [Pseudodesulfovibrio sp. zrk46]QJB57552.1 [FeFe] hydrogenase H-cluster radical SAM maturase HydG [Pseudodesulfovibrio sp. zrk46]
MKKNSTLSQGLTNFIDEELIFEEIAKAENPSPNLVREVLNKGLERNGLSPFETAVLLKNTDPELDEAIFETAMSIKQGIYGNRLVLFAPLYITNECGNQCEYCGFNAKNRDLERRTLNSDEIRAEVEVLENQGHKRLLLVYGEHPKYDADWIAQTVRDVYSVTTDKSGEIRRVNINCAPLDVAGFRKIHEVGIGTYQCFHETYHRETYEKLHTGGRKTDYLWRLHAMHRAMEAGIDDVGMGALFGLYDPTFEVLGLLHHAKQLERDYGVGPHTISFPRLEPALGAEIAFNPPHPTSKHDFKKIVAALRIAVPYTGLILTTRENAEFRRELIEVGVSQISAGSRTYPGAYSDPEYDRPDVQQFCIGDNRSLDEIILSIAGEHGYVPSWCTACYRMGRTGEHFMELAKTGFIQEFCLPNGLLTFKEYLEDYASDETKAAGNALIQREVEAYDDPKRKKILMDRLARMEAGERDLYI